MKRQSLFFVLLGLIILLAQVGVSAAPSPRNIRLKKIVIDPGHGGVDPGAVGKKYRESDLALAIALKLGALIKENYPEIEVVYTRKTDVFVELYKRAKMANECGADLFISIHCNASKNTSALGTETWVMGLHKSQANLEVSKLENSSILYEDDYADQYDGFNPNSPEAHIIFTFFQNLFLDQSLKLAAQVQNQFDKRLQRVNRGVKQAGFLVLYKAAMPSILIETGFISHPEEEVFLGSDQGQNQIAQGIFRAIRTYKNTLEGQDAIEEDTLVLTPNIQLDTSNNKTVVIPDTGNKEPAVFFRVQFTLSSVKKNTSSDEFRNIPDVRVYYQSGLYKYTSGNFSSLEEAIQAQNDIQKKGFKDAFVVAFAEEQRISVETAREMLKNQKK